MKKGKLAGLFVSVGIAALALAAYWNSDAVQFARGSRQQRLGREKSREEALARNQAVRDTMEKDRAARQAEAEIQLQAQNVLIQGEIARRNAEAASPPPLVDRARKAPKGWKTIVRSGLQFEIPHPIRGKRADALNLAPGQTLRWKEISFIRQEKEPFRAGDREVDLNQFRKQSPDVAHSFAEWESWASSSIAVAVHSENSANEQINPGHLSRDSFRVGQLRVVRTQGQDDTFEPEPDYHDDEFTPAILSSVPFDAYSVEIPDEGKDRALVFAIRPANPSGSALLQKIVYSVRRAN